MMHIISSSSYPIKYLSCGNLQSPGGFLHKRRSIDSFVFIVVQEGTLSIFQNNTNYHLKKDDYIFLPKNTEHFGLYPSDDFLSYSWMHFDFQSSYIIQEDSDDAGSYLLPITGTVKGQVHLPLLFHQLMNLSLTEHITPDTLNYCASTMLLLLTPSAHNVNNESKDLFPIKQWIVSHYKEDLSLQSVAAHFHYNADYLSHRFTTQTGESFTHFLNSTRIQAAKNLIMNEHLSTAELAYSCGYHDEKYFLRVFKKLEKMTPRQYREAFAKRHINTE